MAQLSNAGAASSASQAPPDLWERIQGYFRPSMLIVLGAYCKLSLQEWSYPDVLCSFGMETTFSIPQVSLLQTNGVTQTSS
jgi:hypothetical protein